MNDEKEDSKDIQMQLILKDIDDNNLTLKALDGFLLVLSDEGDVTYVSENICDILGLSKVNNNSNIKLAGFIINVNDKHTCYVLYFRSTCWGSRFGNISMRVTTKNFEKPLMAVRRHSHKS